MSDKKDTQKYLQQLADQGYIVTLGGNNHWQVRWNGRLVTVAGLSPNGGCRALDNMKAQVRRFERKEEADASQGQGDRT